MKDPNVADVLELKLDLYRIHQRLETMHADNTNTAAETAALNAATAALEAADKALVEFT